jgi:hypothetical protein
MALREEIEAAFGQAAAEGGARVLAVDGDDKVWLAGLAATDGWILPLPPSAGQAARGAAAAVSALVDGLGVPRDAHAAVSFTQRGAKDLVAAVEALGSGREEKASVDPVGGPNALAMVTVGERIRVQALWPGKEALELAGFELDPDRRVSTREVEPEQAVGAAEAALRALGIDAGDPLFIHLGD